MSRTMLSLACAAGLWAAGAASAAQPAPAPPAPPAVRSVLDDPPAPPAAQPLPEPQRLEGALPGEVLPEGILPDGAAIEGAPVEGGYAPEADYGVYGVRNPDLFYNYYVPAVNGGVPAQMYLSPRPTPPWVGHTYYTYQPFLPHEHMYRHYREYYNYQGQDYPGYDYRGYRASARGCGRCAGCRAGGRCQYLGVPHGIPLAVRCPICGVHGCGHHLGHMKDGASYNRTSVLWTTGPVRSSYIRAFNIFRPF